jgi:hypothetical protein
MIRLFGTPDGRLKRKNEAILRRIKDVHLKKKLEFRQSLISKMKFMNPSMVMMANSQSDVFFGYDPKEKYFVSGMFYDSLLGDLFEIEEKVDDPDFSSHAQYFLENMSEEISDSDKCSVAGRHLYNNVYPQDGYCISENPPGEIRVKKNGKVIARSSPFSPKCKGYFKEALYRNVVEDTGGKGVSNIQVTFGLCNGGQLDIAKTFYVYEDHPRRKSVTNIEHYITVCSLFTPFLEAIEEDLLTENINSEDYLYYLSNGYDEDADDTLLGLPANPRSTKMFELKR